MEWLDKIGTMALLVAEAILKLLWITILYYVSTIKGLLPNNGDGMIG